MFAGATFVVRTGALPAPAVGPALTMGGRLGHTLLAGEIGFVTPTTATAASRPDQGAIFWLAQVGARAGYLWSAPSAAGATPRLEVGPCVGVSIERTAASGFGSREPADATAWAGVASGGGLVLVHFFDRLALRASIEAAAPLARPRFVIQGTGQVHQPTAVGARVGVGVDFQF